MKKYEAIILTISILILVIAILILAIYGGIQIVKKVSVKEEAVKTEEPAHLPEFQEAFEIADRCEKAKGLTEALECLEELKAKKKEIEDCYGILLMGEISDK